MQMKLTLTVDDEKGIRLEAEHVPDRATVLDILEMARQATHQLGQQERAQQRGQVFVPGPGLANRLLNGK